MSLRAITLTIANPSQGATAINRTLGWEIEEDFGAFASLKPPTGPPLWLNVPHDGEALTSGLILHIATDDVDRSFDNATSQGASKVRQPQNMDYGERSASVAIDEVPGVTFDFSTPLDH